jgi:hypothetical protein
MISRRCLPLDLRFFIVSGVNMGWAITTGGRFQEARAERVKQPLA